MDGKVAIALIAEILYIKGIICFQEYEALYDMRTAQDVEPFVEKLLRGEFNVYKRGESYLNYGSDDAAES